MKKVLILLVVLALVGSASAVNKTWAGGVFGSASDEWMLGTADQWADPAVVPVTPPDANDYAIILHHTYGPYSLLPYPTIRTDVGQVAYLGVSLHSDATAELTLETGARLHVVNATTIAGDEAKLGNSFGTVNIDGGTLITTYLSVGTTYDANHGYVDPANGIGQINLNAGTLHAGAVDYLGPNCNIDIEIGPYFHITGDMTPYLQLFVDNGTLSSSDGDGTTHLEWDFGVTVAGLTSIWAVEGAVCSSYLVSDINGDCVTDVEDLVILASEWLLLGL